MVRSKLVHYVQTGKIIMQVLKNSTKEEQKVVALDRWSQIQLHYILVHGTQKRWLLKISDPLIEVTT